MYFKGIRIAAGISQYKQAITDAKLEYKEKAADATETEKKQLKAELDKVVAENRKAIQQARYDQKHCDKEYAEERVAAVKAEYLPKLEKLQGEEKNKLTQEYKNELRKAKNTRLVTQIQMIFQDPIASLDPRMTVQ